MRRWVYSEMNNPLFFDRMIAALEALAEPTRLRLAILLSEAELTVTELTSILGQSQPRISRHLKLLVEADLVDRHREGAWAFFRLADATVASIVAHLRKELDFSDPVLTADRARLVEARAARAAQAAQYFASRAQVWDKLRALHIGDARVEQTISQLIGAGEIGSLLDLGTGTGRMLEILSRQSTRAVGVDQSPAMLAVARANLERAGVSNVQLRQGDIYALPVERDAYDLVVVHQVLHYLDDPARALREAIRTLAPGGRFVVVDFAPHVEERLRDEHAHRRLGFEKAEIESILVEAGLKAIEFRALAPQPGSGAKLTVSIWLGQDQRAVSVPNVPRIRMA
jgi:ubiquinone/menaquinone biosynthesis C-methylase UbiE/DNA-binding transcriptional ArsR family regulator